MLDTAKDCKTLQEIQIDKLIFVTNNGFLSKVSCYKCT